MSTLVILPGTGATPPAAPIVGLWVGVILETPGIVHGGVRLPSVAGDVLTGSVAGRTTSGSAASDVASGSVYGRVSTSSVSSDWMVKP